MSVSYTGNRIHDAVVNAAEVVRQNAVVAGASRATVIAAETTFHRTCAKSALANSCGAETFLTALRELGQPLYP